MKKKILTLCVLVLLLAIAGTGTLAYFTGEATAHNVITSSGIDITLVEKTLVDGRPVDFPEAGIPGVMPGDEVSKQVWVHNNQESAWVRVNVSTSVTSADGEELPADVILVNYLLKGPGNEYKWIDGGDGYFYYTEPVAANQNTDKLFETVKLDAVDMDNAYQGCSINIVVAAEAVQSANNPIPADGDVTGVKGWPQKDTE